MCDKPTRYCVESSRGSTTQKRALSYTRERVWKRLPTVFLRFWDDSFFGGVCVSFYRLQKVKTLGQFLSVALIFFFFLTFSGIFSRWYPDDNTSTLLPSWFVVPLHVFSSLIPSKETKRYTKGEIGRVQNQSAIKRCLGHANAHFLSSGLVGNRVGMRLDREAKQKKKNKKNKKKIG